MSEKKQLNRKDIILFLFNYVISICKDKNFKKNENTLAMGLTGIDDSNSLVLYDFDLPLYAIENEDKEDIIDILNNIDDVKNLLYRCKYDLNKVFGRYSNLFFIRILDDTEVHIKIRKMISLPSNYLSREIDFSFNLFDFCKIYDKGFFDDNKKESIELDTTEKTIIDLFEKLSVFLTCDYWNFLVILSSLNMLPDDFNLKEHIKEFLPYAIGLKLFPENLEIIPLYKNNKKYNFNYDSFVTKFNVDDLNQYFSISYDSSVDELILGGGISESEEYKWYIELLENKNWEKFKKVSLKKYEESGDIRFLKNANYCNIFLNPKDFVDNEDPILEKIVNAIYRVQNIDENASYFRHELYLEHSDLFDNQSDGFNNIRIDLLYFLREYFRKLSDWDASVECSSKWLFINYNKNDIELIRDAHKGFLWYYNERLHVSCADYLAQLKNNYKETISKYDRIEDFLIDYYHFIFNFWRNRDNLSERIDPVDLDFMRDNINKMSDYQKYFFSLILLFSNHTHEAVTALEAITYGYDEKKIKKLLFYIHYFLLGDMKNIDYSIMDDEEKEYLSILDINKKLPIKYEKYKNIIDFIR